MISSEEMNCEKNQRDTLFYLLPAYTINISHLSYSVSTKSVSFLRCYSLLLNITTTFIYQNTIPTTHNLKHCEILSPRDILIMDIMSIFLL